MQFSLAGSFQEMAQARMAGVFYETSVLAVAGSFETEPDGYKLCDPNCYINRPLADDDPLDQTLASDGVTLLREACRQQIINEAVLKISSASPLVNTGTFSPNAQIVNPSTPRQKVLFLDSSRNPVIDYMTGPKAAIAQLLSEEGMPIPDGYIEPGAGLTGQDNPYSAYDPYDVRVDSYTGKVYKGTLWEGFHLKRSSIRAGYPYECQNAGRILGVNQDSTSPNPGRGQDRYATVDSPTLPSDPIKRLVWEKKTLTATASSLPLYPLMLRLSDIQAGFINHALGMAVVYPNSTGLRLPAVRSEGGNNGKPIVMGMRFRFPYDMPRPTNLTAIGGMVFDALKKYGCVIWDMSGAVAFRAEPAVKNTPAWDTTQPQLANFPWDRLELIADLAPGVW